MLGTEMAELDLRLIRIFNCIYETKSLTEAAAALSVTQPAVSYSLARLRHQLSDPLFVRTASGMLPTARATELFGVFSRSLEDIETAVGSVGRFDPATSRRTFRLCLTDLGEMAFLPAITRYLAVEAPNVTLEVVPMQIDQVSAWFMRGEVDAAIASSSLPGLDHRTLLDHGRYVCVLPQNLLGSVPVISVEELRSLRHIVIDPSTGHSQVDVAISELGIERKVGLRLHHFSVLPNVLVSGGFAAIIPFRLAEMFMELWPLQIRELPFHIPSHKVNLYWGGSRTQSEGVKWFLEALGRSLEVAPTVAGE
jgi:DNA-binding transcriptional LysR family regulator